jgi:hydroxybutyrate-dimer hydrolase
LETFFADKTIANGTKSMNSKPAFQPSKVITIALTTTTAIAAMLTGCSTVSTSGAAAFQAPSITAISKQTYDGQSNDLLTAGLGKTGLLQAALAPLANPEAPSIIDLRQRAIHANYRALIDASPAGGFTRFYGPNMDLTGKDTLGEGKIAGDEYLASVSIGGATAMIMVQIPRSLNKENPCIVTATSSGSRGVYGAIGTAGEWGLKRGCVVAYTDKGTGTGFHLLGSNLVYDWSGSLVDAGSGPNNFSANLDEAARKAYIEKNPHRIAVKQAHNQHNGERLWGQFTLAAVRYAFTVMNGLTDDRKAASGSYTAANTFVIASSVSNGAYAALQAAEQDTEGLIDAVVATEPNVSIANATGYSIRQGDKVVPSAGRSLLDYTTLLNLYVPCAANDPRMASAPLNLVPKALRDNRCEALKANGYLTSVGVAAQAAESIDKLLAAGIQAEALTLLPSHYALNVYQGIAVAYAMQYGRLSVTEELCGYSYAATAAANAASNPLQPIGIAGAALAFATSNGIVPTAGISLVNQKSKGGPREDRSSVSPNDANDMNIAGAICLREVATGKTVSGAMLKDGQSTEQKLRADWAARVAKGIGETQMTGNLRGKPTIIISPRSDAVLPLNHAGRAYFAHNRNVDNASLVRYYEITNAQHLDTLNGIAGFSNNYVPIHAYFNQSMNLMWDHLTQKRALPPSQLVRTVLRATKDGKLDDLAATNIPPISATLDANTLIRMQDTQLVIPE